MKKKFIIKLCKIRKSTKDKNTRLIVVGLNNSRSNGAFLEKIGVYSIYNERFPISYKTMRVCSINLKRLGFWLNKGALVKSKPSWLIGLLGAGESIYKKK